MDFGSGFGSGGSGVCSPWPMTIEAVELLLQSAQI